MLSIKSLSYDLQVKWSRVSDTNLFNTDCHDQAFSSRGRLWAVHFGCLVFTRSCKLERFELFLLFPLNSSRRVWADASSACLHHSEQHRILFQLYWKKTKDICGCFLLLNEEQLWICDLLGLTFRIVLFCSDLVLQPQLEMYFTMKKE